MKIFNQQFHIKLFLLSLYLRFPLTFYMIGKTFLIAYSFTSMSTGLNDEL